MSAPKQNKQLKQLISLMGVASASILLSFPAAALSRFNSSMFQNASPTNTRPSELNGKNRLLLAQNTSGTNQQNPAATTNQQYPAGTTNRQNPAATTNQQYPTGTTQQNSTGTTTQQYPTGTTQQNSAGTTTQQNPGTVVIQQYPRGYTQPDVTGTTNQQNSTPSTQQNTTGTPTRSIGATAQPNSAATGTNQPNGRQDAFTQYMLAGYAATDQRDYQTALDNFKNALQLRPGNSYATQAISNVQSYIQQQGTRQQRSQQQTTPRGRTQ